MTAPARPSPSASLVEYFTLARASDASTKLGAARRKEVETALTIGRQRGDAAETLWSNGHSAEGLRLAFASLDDTIEAAALLAEPAEAAPAPGPAPEPAPAEPQPEAGEAPPAKPEPAASRADEPWRRTLRARGARPAKIESVAQTLVAARAASLPKLYADVSPSLA